MAHHSTLLRSALGVTVTLALSPIVSSAKTTVDFEKQVKPILEAACVNCHDEKEAEGDLRLDSLEHLLKGGDSGAALVPGDPEKSLLYTLSTLPADDTDVMPTEKSGGPLAKAQTDVLKAWIEEGANWPEGIKLTSVPRIHFEKHIQPVIEQNCITCHNPNSKKSDFDMTTVEATLSTAEDPALIAFDPGNSGIFILANLPADDDDVMPPEEPLSKGDIDKIRMWIEQGALWPTSLTLKARSKLETDRRPSLDTLLLAQKIHDLIEERSKISKEENMKAYTNSIPRSGVPYHMLPIPGGEFIMGSPDGEKHRREDEGPQAKVKVDPFWMGKFEVTWDEYKPFSSTSVDRYKDGTKKFPEPADTIVDAVSMPTPAYMEMSFGMGQDGFPAISMTQHAANKYCQWLSAQTGHFYRLPTEAEWEYACRAGSTSSYHFGDNTDDLEGYGWYYDNSDGKYQKVGEKKPNAWGLHDMHGNVSEWTIDQYEPKYYLTLKRKPGSVLNPRSRVTELYPCTVRGGNWDDDPDGLRSAARVASSANWKQRDPQLPKSLWYHTDTQWLGFRIVRPLTTPSAEEMYHYWTTGVAGQE